MGGGMGMGEFEGIGDAVTGSLLARAVEPQAGEAGADGHTHEKNCLNCGTRLTDACVFSNQEPPCQPDTISAISSRAGATCPCCA